MKSLICLVLILTLGSSVSLFNLQLLPKTNGAMCMDGSNHAIYTYMPDD